MALSKYLLSSFLTLVLIIQLCFQAGVVQRVFAESPSFVRQEIIDESGDWLFWKGSSTSSSSSTSNNNKAHLHIHNGAMVEVDKANDISECEVSGNKFISPDIQSVSYISDGKKLNATVWLSSPFQEPPLNDTIDVFQEQLNIKISKTNLTLKQYTDVNIARLLDPSLELEIDENSTMISGNQQAHKVVYTDRRGGEGGRGQNEIKVLEIWTVEGDKAYDITYSASPSKYNEYLPIIQEMLETFKIISSSPSTSPIDNKSPLIIKNQSNTAEDFLTYEGHDIRIKYPSNWEKEEIKNNKSTSSVIVRFLSPFEDKGSNIPSWHEITFTMAIDIDSVHDAGTDYRIIYSRIPYHTLAGNWTRQVQEISAYDNVKVLEDQNNYTDFYNNNDNNKGEDGENTRYITFSFDLGKINSPRQYKAVFYITDYFVKAHRFCRLLDTTNWVIIPPPEFSMTASPSSVVLRPSEEKNIELQIKGNTDLQSEASLTSSNNNNYAKDINIDFIPSRTSIPASGAGTATLHLKASSTAQPKPYTLPIVANISFPTSITNRGGETFSNKKSVSVMETANLTLTILPAYTFQEQLSNFTNTWITPITGIWTFLAGVGAVIVPVIIKLYRNKQKKIS